MAHQAGLPVSVTQASLAEAGAEEPKTQKPCPKKTEAEPAPAPLPIPLLHRPRTIRSASNGYVTAPPVVMTFDELRKRCDKLIEAIPGNDGFDKTSAFLAEFNRIYVKDVPAEKYAEASTPFEAVKAKAA